MKKILTVIIILLSLGAQSQDFAPIGTEWHYTYANFSVFGYVEITSIGDTTINGLECRKLRKYRETFDYLSNEYQYEELGFEIIRNDEDKVYIYRNGLFYTLFDFSAQVSDVWDVPYTYDVSEECDTIGSVEVTAIGDTIIYGESLRYVVVEPLENTAWHLYGMIIEKIGPVDLYFFPEQACMLDFHEGGVFRCFNDGEIFIEVGPYPCGYVTLSTSELNVQSLVCHPNPASHQITFELPLNQMKSSIRIIDIYGKLITELPIAKDQSQFVWDCSGIARGVYFYQTQLNGEVYTGKIVVN